MKTYIGTKIIQAEPKDRDGAPGYMVRYPDGYESWSPAGAFEDAYRMIGAMTFGDAVHMLKLGKRVARAGWNGKGMWLVLVLPDDDELPPAGARYRVADVSVDEALPWIGMKTADRKFVPWLASQTDVLASDWTLA